MEQDVLKKLAQFRILMKKENGAQIDFEKIFSDTSYARHTLRLAEDSDNETLVFLALSLRQKLGLLTPTTPAAPAAEQRAPAPAPTPTASPNAAKKYMFGARG